MKILTWQNPGQLFVAQELINKVKSKCCGIEVDAVKNNEFDEDGSSWYSTVFIHFIDNNTIERGMIYAHKKPQSNAAFSKNIGGTTLYFVVDYLDWVCKYTYKNGALYISNGDIYTFNNGFFYTGDGIKFQKI